MSKLKYATYRRTIRQSNPGPFLITTAIELVGKMLLQTAEKQCDILLPLFSHNRLFACLIRI